MQQAAAGRMIMPRPNNYYDTCEDSMEQQRGLKEGTSHPSHSVSYTHLTLPTILLV